MNQPPPRSEPTPPSRGRLPYPSHQVVGTVDAATVPAVIAALTAAGFPPSRRTSWPVRRASNACTTAAAVPTRGDGCAESP